MVVVVIRNKSNNTDITTHNLLRPSTNVYLFSLFNFLAIQSVNCEEVCPTEYHFNSVYLRVLFYHIFYQSQSKYKHFLLHILFLFNLSRTLIRPPSYGNNVNKIAECVLWGRRGGEYLTFNPCGVMLIKAISLRKCHINISLCLPTI